MEQIRHISLSISLCPYTCVSDFKVPGTPAKLTVYTQTNAQKYWTEDPGLGTRTV